jgi:cell division protein FtsQ
LERVKAIQRNASTAADAESYRPELLADEEPRYLRRQKPVEIRRKKFGGRTWSFYRRVMVVTVVASAGAAIAVAGGRFLLYAPQMLLLKPDQIELTGNHIVSREAVVQQFAHDRNRSVLRIPLDTRRSELEQLPWVESASVQRILPNRLRVELIERTPIAFLRNRNEIALIDAHGVVLDRPEGEDLNFPIVTGVSEDLSRDQREKRMQSYEEFIKEIDVVRAGSSKNVSEIDLSDPRDLRVVMTGLVQESDSQAVTVHFGNGDFLGKYHKLLDNFAHWQADMGCLQSVDLQFKRPVLNPDDKACVARAKAQAPAK